MGAGGRVVGSHFFVYLLKPRGEVYTSTPDRSSYRLYFLTDSKFII